MIKRILFIFLLALSCGNAVAQEFDEYLTLYFRNGDGVYDRDFRSNGVTADEFFEKIALMQNLPGARIKEIVTSGNTSPEGSVEYNRELGEKRRLSFKQEIHKHLEYPDFRIIVNPDPDCWADVMELVAADRNIERKQEVLDIIAGGDDIVKSLIALDNGFTYRYLEEAIFPQLRTFNLKVTFDMSEYIHPAELPDDEQIISSLTCFEDGVDFIENIWSESVPFLKVEKYKNKKYVVIADPAPKKYERKLKRMRTKMERKEGWRTKESYFDIPYIPAETNRCVSAPRLAMETEIPSPKPVTAAPATAPKPATAPAPQIAVPVEKKPEAVPVRTAPAKQENSIQWPEEKKPEVKAKPEPRKREKVAPEDERLMSIKTNLAGLAFSVVNLGLEFDLGENLALNIPVYYSGWDYAKTMNMFKGLIVQPELRYYITRNKGFFAGIHLGAAWYNLTWGGDYRYQNTGWYRPTYGGGIGVGYRLALGRNSGWKMEFAVGGGVYDARYDKFFNEPNGPYAARKVNKVYYGLDQAAISLTYSFNIRRGGRR